MRLQQKEKYPEEHRTKLSNKCHNCLVIRERIKRCKRIGKAVEGGHLFQSFHRTAGGNYLNAGFGARIIWWDPRPHQSWSEQKLARIINYMPAKYHRIRLNLE